jgi:hypothetical protein
VKPISKKSWDIRSSSSNFSKFKQTRCLKRSQSLKDIWINGCLFN